jgi:hypothetical protein
VPYSFAPGDPWRRFIFIHCSGTGTSVHASSPQITPKPPTRCWGPSIFLFCRVRHELGSNGPGVAGCNLLALKLFPGLKTIDPGNASHPTAACLGRYANRPFPGAEMKLPRPSGALFASAPSLTILCPRHVPELEVQAAIAAIVLSRQRPHGSPSRLKISKFQACQSGPSCSRSVRTPSVLDPSLDPHGHIYSHGLGGDFPGRSGS